VKVIIVVPTNREKTIREFLKSWETEFASAHIFVVEDNATRSFDLGDCSNVTHFAWEHIDHDLGRESWIIPRGSDCIRSYGYFKAYSECPDLIITMDDDCYPTPDQTHFIERHWKRIQMGGEREAWCATGTGTISRGVPYFSRTRNWPCVINHGLWIDTPDYDSPTQLLQNRNSFEFIPINQTIPVGMYFPMCGMNLAFLPQVVPAMYFLLMGENWKYHRFGDIWAGIMIKKICDHLGYVINSGEPWVSHRRASNIWDNLSKETPGLRVNEEVWCAVDRIILHGDTFAECYAEIARELTLSCWYWTELKKAMSIWAGLFAKT